MPDKVELNTMATSSVLMWDAASLAGTAAIMSAYSGYAMDGSATGKATKGVEAGFGPQTNTC